MSIRANWSLGILVVCLALPAAARAQKMDKDDKKFLDDVGPIMLPDEEKTYKGLKDKADRQEFQKIFWARRDPNLETPENEFETAYRKKVAEADARYKVVGHAGSDTDCGRVFILLGEPDDVKKDQAEGSQGGRYPETWTYRDRPGQTFQGGEARIMFDPECRAQARAIHEQLDQVAVSRIAHPNFDYRYKDGHLVKLDVLMSQSMPVLVLLKQPRQDFPVATQIAYLKEQSGGTALMGLVHGEAAGLTTEDVGGKKTVKLVVVANAVGEDGKVAAFAEQKTSAEVLPDGSFLTSYRMGLKPGKYTLQAGALDEKAGKGSLVSVPIEVPDLNKGELSMASLILLREVEDVPAGTADDPQHPLAAFLLGQARLIPWFGTTFSKKDALSFFYQVYDLKVDEATGAASGVASLSLLKGGKVPVAKAPDQPLERAIGGSVVGPVPLDKYEPGPYLIQLKVKDKLANKELVQEVPFEIKP